MSRYRKIDPRIWNDERFVKLDSDEKLIAIYAFTAQSNRIGIFKFSPAMAAEQLDMGGETFAKRFDNVCKALRWTFDKGLRVLYIPTWWKYNTPENPNVLQSNLDDLHDLPQTPLLTEFASNVAYLPATQHERFNLTLAKGLPERMAHQEQEQEQEQKQEQEQEKPPAAEGVLIPAVLDTPEFLAAWGDWQKYRREIGKKLKPTTAKAQLAELEAMGPLQAIGSLHQSIKNGWTGIFENKAKPRPIGAGTAVREDN